MSKLVLGSLARIADFDTGPFEVEPVPRSEWETGDYVQADVVGKPTRLYHIECTTGEMIGVEPGDRVIGAFGRRAATLEGVGSWMEIDGGEMGPSAVPGVDVLDGLGQPLLGTSAEEDVGPLAGQGLGDAEAEPTARGGDHRPLAGQLQIHWDFPSVASGTGRFSRGSGSAARARSAGRG